MRRALNVRFTHAMCSCVAGSSGHVSIFASGLEDWFKHALIAHLSSSRLVVHGVDKKRPGTAFVFTPEINEKDICLNGF